ncbi:facilitated trehalose transporter Tret1 [Anabrus simplex]|uniref:facilitated trehalose transporter Tret1 n=1 Tax=Anabrus simplex TaxID=316456 RepID=UPI0035A27128
MEKDLSVLKQHVAALLASLAAMSAGIAIGWTAPALPLLQAEEPAENVPLRVSVDEGSWISSLLPLGALFGAMPAGLMADWMGRKKAILSLAFPYTLGWLLILFADETIVLVYVGRFLCGLATGATTVLVPQYNEEIAEDAIRGALGIYMDFMLCNGVTLINIFGAYLSYTWFTIASCIASAIFLFTFVWVPESPVYLIMKDRMEEATEALSWLRQGKRSYDVQEELRYLQVNLISQSDDQEPRPFCDMLMRILNKLSFKSRTFRTVFIVYGLMVFQIVGGIDAVLFYTVDIFNDVGSDLSSNVSSIIVAVCQSVCNLISAFYVDSLGRRPMLLISAFITAVCHAALAIYFYFKGSGIDMESWSWIPVVALILFVIGFTVGFSQLPWLMMAELVPTRTKTWVNAGAVTLNWTMVFVITKDFPDMVQYLGNDVTYGLFSCMCVMSFVFVAIWVPETKGKSREEIQEALSIKKKVTSSKGDFA